MVDGALGNGKSRRDPRFATLELILILIMIFLVHEASTERPASLIASHVPREMSAQVSLSRVCNHTPHNNN
jgi:hypothetical protein